MCRSVIKESLLIRNAWDSVIASSLLLFHLFFFFFSSERSFLDVKPAVSNQPWIGVTVSWAENESAPICSCNFCEVFSPKSPHRAQHKAPGNSPCNFWVVLWFSMDLILNFKIFFVKKGMEFCSISEKSIRQRGSVAVFSGPGWESETRSSSALATRTVSGSSYRISRQNGDVGLEALGFEKIQCSIPGF